MKRIQSVVTFLSILLAASFCTAGTSVELGISADGDGVKSFHLAISQHYGVSTKSIEILKEEKLSEDEMSVAFFLAERVPVSAHKMARLRLKGMTWMEIARRYNLTAEVFYIDVKDAGGPPYGKAYGHFKGKKRKAWKTLNLTNREIIDLVNLRFISVHYGYSIPEIIKMREKNKSFVKIAKNVKKIQKEKREKAQVSKAVKQQKAVEKKKAHKGKGKK